MSSSSGRPSARARSTARCGSRAPAGARSSGRTHPSARSATRGSRGRRAASGCLSCSARCRRPSSGALQEASGVEREPEPFELRIGEELAVTLEDLLDRFDRPGPKPVHTGLPFTIVSATITYEPTRHQRRVDLEEPARACGAPTRLPSTTSVRQLGERALATRSTVASSSLAPST